MYEKILIGIILTSHLLYGGGPTEHVPVLFNNNFVDDDAVEPEFRFVPSLSCWLPNLRINASRWKLTDFLKQIKQCREQYMEMRTMGTKESRAFYFDLNVLHYFKRISSDLRVFYESIFKNRAHCRDGTCQKYENDLTAGVTYACELGYYPLAKMIALLGLTKYEVNFFERIIASSLYRQEVLASKDNEGVRHDTEKFFEDCYGLNTGCWLLQNLLKQQKERQGKLNQLIVSCSASGRNSAHNQLPSNILHYFTRKYFSKLARYIDDMPADDIAEVSFDDGIPVEPQISLNITATEKKEFFHEKLDYRKDEIRLQVAFRLAMAHCIPEFITLFLADPNFDPQCLYMRTKAPHYLTIVRDQYRTSAGNERRRFNSDRCLDLFRCRAEYWPFLDAEFKNRNSRLSKVPKELFELLKQQYLYMHAFNKKRIGLPSYCETSTQQELTLLSADDRFINDIVIPSLKDVPETDKWLPSALALLRAKKFNTVILEKFIESLIFQRTIFEIVDESEIPQIEQIWQKCLTSCCWLLENLLRHREMEKEKLDQLDRKLKSGIIVKRSNVDECHDEREKIAQREKELQDVLCRSIDRRIPEFVAIFLANPTFEPNQSCFDQLVTTLQQIKSQNKTIDDSQPVYRFLTLFRSYLEYWPEIEKEHTFNPDSLLSRLPMKTFDLLKQYYLYAHAFQTKSSQIIPVPKTTELQSRLTESLSAMPQVSPMARVKLQAG